MDDFLLRALAAGAGAALAAGPLGCFVVWRRLAYFGDTMAHSALLGLALGFLLGFAPVLGIAAVTVVAAGLLMTLERRTAVPTDTLLGILSHGALALGLVAIGLMSWLRVDLMGVLFGDVLAVSLEDIALIYAAAGIVLLCLWRIWEPLLAATVSSDLAQAEGLAGRRASLLFTLLLALVIAVSIKVVGVLLITSLLILPAAAARRWSRSPEAMVAGAVLIGLVSVCAGLGFSVELDTPAGPSIVLVAFVIFLLGLPRWRIGAGLR
ncbi:metal ABC transporter permease [Nisaea acidiphila]|uniref:High-affinity zinc uptake system membrane protein ZnuB n=1 Tax=Nisaea acidiphila TaxID=1862145 RepID=A0A9J7AYU4_9PROT|nr:metal ABC transporter permease [Nisaea acidiphila]